MAVLNRQMFRQPFPVVRRMAGTPKEGEVTVEDYIDKGYDTYEYTADQDQKGWSDDKIRQWKEEQAVKFKNRNKGGIFQWLKEQGKKVGDFMGTGWADREDLLFIGNEYFDPDDPNFRLFIENNYMQEGDSFIDGIEKFREFVETSSGRGDDTKTLIEAQKFIVPRQAGSPPTGEIDYYTKELNPEIVKEQDIAIDKQIGSWDMEKKLYKNRSIRETNDDLTKIADGTISTPTLVLDNIANAFNVFGKDRTLEILRQNGFDEKNSKVFDYLSGLGDNFFYDFLYELEMEGRKGLYEYVGQSDDYDFERMPAHMKKYVGPLMEIMSTDIVPRQAGSPMQGEITPQESNLYYGDQGEQALYAQLLKVLRGEIIGIEAQQVMQAALGEFGEDFIKSLMAKGNNITSPAEGQFSGMPHQGAGLDGPYWNQAVSRQAGSPPMGEQDILMDKQTPSMYFGDSGEQRLHRELRKVANGQITDPKEIQAIITASIGEFGEGHVKSILQEGGALMSPAEGQFSGMPHQGTGMDGPYWNQAVSRQMGSPQMGEQVNANNVGIMDGFEGEQVAEQVMSKGSAAKDEIDKSDTYDELMQSIRGDDLTEHDRRQELAGIVGEKDAYETPDSVLALVQPVIQMLDMEESQQGIGATDQAQAMNIPVEPEEVVGIQETMAANGGLIRRYGHGGPIQYFNQGELAEKHAQYSPTYMGIVDKYFNPKQGEADALFALSRAGFNWGLGASPTEASALFFDELSKKGSERAKEERALRMKMDLGALSAAQAEMLAETKAKKEKSKQKQNLTVGLNKETDDFIAKILGVTKWEKTQGGEETVIDWDKFYRLYPEGTSLQWSWDWTQFFGKKGSAIRYEGVKKEKDGGIVHRQDGTPEDGEVIDIDEIFLQKGVESRTEKDDINKIVARSQATLKELLRMKEILVSHPEIGGFPGMMLETFQGLFTMIDQIDDAYLGDKIFREEGKLSKMFNKAEIQEIQMLKNSIAAGIADLRSFKGTRQPTEKQQELSLGEIDPTGWFGRDVAMQKVDAVASKVARLVKEYVKILTTVEGSSTIDKAALLGKFQDIDAFVDSIHNFALKEETDAEDVYTLEDLEAIINTPTEGN